MDESVTVQRLKAAIAAQDDELAEKLVQRLAGADEAALIRMAESDDADSRWWAVRSLALVGADQCVDTVVAALGDSNSALRAAGALALAHLHGRAPDATRAAMPALAQMLTDDDGLVRQSAADSLAMCGDDAVEALAVIIDSLHDGARGAGGLFAAQDLHGAGGRVVVPAAGRSEPPCAILRIRWAGRHGCV